MYYVPMLLAVDTDDLDHVIGAAQIYAEGAVDGESTKLCLPPQPMILAPGDVGTVAVPEGGDW